MWGYNRPPPSLRPRRFLRGFGEDKGPFKNQRFPIRPGPLALRHAQSKREVAIGALGRALGWVQDGGVGFPATVWGPFRLPRGKAGPTMRGTSVRPLLNSTTSNWMRFLASDAPALEQYRVLSDKKSSSFGDKAGVVTTNRRRFAFEDDFRPSQRPPSRNPACFASWASHQSRGRAGDQDLLARGL